MARLDRYRLVMAILWTLVIMTLCWLPRDAVREIEGQSTWFELANLDKVVHAGIFVCFAILWTRVSLVRRRFVWTALGGVALAVVTEIVQGLPAVGRDGSFADGMTDIVGLVLGLLAAPHVEPLARSIESLAMRTLGSQPPDGRERPVASSERGTLP